MEQLELRDAAALRAWLKAVVAEGGEGLMLHRADAPVVQGAATCCSSSTDHGRRGCGARPCARPRSVCGPVGALEVQTPGGRSLPPGTGFSEAQRRQPPPVGSKVSYRYRDLTDAGVPRFASFLRVADEFETESFKASAAAPPASGAGGGRECSFGGSGCAWWAPG